MPSEPGVLPSTQRYTPVSIRKVLYTVGLLVVLVGGGTAGYKMCCGLPMCPGLPHCR